MTWLVAIHEAAAFKVVAVADSEEEAKMTAAALSVMGRPFYWEVKELEAEG